MVERAATDGVCPVCRQGIRRGEPVRGIGDHASGRFAHAACAGIRSGTETCACRHPLADHPVAEGGRCSNCACVWFHGAADPDRSVVGDTSPSREEPNADGPPTGVGEEAGIPDVPADKPRVDRHQAARTLRALIDGVHPGTGEVLPDDGPYNDPDVLRALFLAIEALNGATRGEKRRPPMPPNHGKAWSKDEDQELLELFDSGVTVSELARQFERSRGSIRARLVKYGRIDGAALEVPPTASVPRPA